MTAVDDRALNSLVEQGLAERARVVQPFFEGECKRIAALCHAMAARFERGGRLIALGSSSPARSDARHIAVEFVHPVIVGKRALPAIAICDETCAANRQLRLVARSDDIVFALDSVAEKSEFVDVSRSGRDALQYARELGCLTVALNDPRADWTFNTPTTDGFIWQELTEILYHVVWELVHVYFDHGATSLANASHVPAPPATSAANFLYPFLNRQQQSVNTVHDEVQQSIIAKARESAALSAELVGVAESDNRRMLLAAGRTIMNAFHEGGTLFAIGNGGSATDASDAVADYSSPPPHFNARAAVDLTDNSAIITALTNDVGADVVFSRQIIAYARKHDVVLAFTTSGNSRNVIQALHEARRQQLKTIAFVGYGGGSILHDQLADHVIATHSQHVPRIQEAHAAAHHLLRALVG